MSLTLSHWSAGTPTTLTVLLTILQTTLSILFLFSSSLFTVIDHAKSNDKKSLVSLLLNSEPVAASEDHVLVKFLYLLFHNEFLHQI
jgi:hypothetical protein